MSWLSDNLDTSPAANVAFRIGSQTPADQAAQDAVIARRFGITPASVAADRDLYRQRAKAQDATAAISGAPKTADWIAKAPIRGAMAQDDAGAMASIEGFFAHPFTAMGNGLHSAVQGLDDFVRWTPKKGEDLPIAGQVTSIPLALVASLMGDPEAQQTVSQSVGKLPSALWSGTLGLVSNTAGYLRGTQEFGEQYDITAGLQRRMFGGTIEGVFGNVFRELSDRTAQSQAYYMPKTPNWATNQVLGGISNIPGTAAALTTGVATKLLGATTEAASLTGALTGGVQQGGQSYNRARAQGLDVNKSFLYANIDLATETAGEYVGEFQFLKATEGGSSLLTRFLRSQLGEQVGEQFSTVAQDFSAWAVLPENHSKTFGDYLAQLPGDMAATAVQTLVAGGVTNVAIGAVERAANLPAFQARREAAETRAALVAHAQLTAVLAAAGETKLRENDPVTFQNYMESQTKDTAHEFTYIDGQTLNQLLAEGGENSATLLSALPSIGPQLQQAIETGGDVRIPTAELVTGLPGHALEQKLVENLRTDPMSPSVAELKTTANDQIAKLTKTFGDQLKEAGLDNEFNASRDRVAAGFADQLKSANRFNADTNRQYSELLGNFFAVQAQHLGITPEEMAARYPLTVRSVEGNQSTGENRTSQGAILNVGLSTAELGDGSMLDTQHVLSVLAKHGADVTGATIHASDSEPTLVANLAHPISKEQGDAISTELKQEAIVQRRGKEGDLFGPQAENWGPYNPSFFVMPDGTRADTVREEAAQHREEVLNQATIAREVKAEQAAWTPERIDKLIETYSDPAYGQAYVAVMAPQDFLNLTLSEKGQATLASMDPGKTRARPLDPNQLRDVDQPILLGMSNPTEPSSYQRSNVESLRDAKYLPSNTTAHEGRHRMTALRAAGFQQVPVVIEMTNWQKADGKIQPLDEIKMTPQRSRLDDNNNGAAPATLNNLIPIREEYRGELEALAKDANLLFQGTRGYLTFGNDITAQASTITLLKASDLSTFLHESGHFFLEVMSHVAAQPGAPKQITDDMAAALKWMGFEGDNVAWREMSIDDKREFHEKFARGFEAYLFEGKAPNIELRGVFQRFRSWLVAVYQNNIDKLRAPLDSEIRGVFNRLIASEASIRAAEADARLGDYFSEKPENMTDTAWHEYQALGAEATATAVDSLQSKSLRDMRFSRSAHSRELKRLVVEVADKRAAVESEVRDETMTEPVYGAMEYIRSGMLNGEIADGPHKLDIEAVNALYDGYAKEDLAAVKKQLGYGKNGLLASKDGVNPEQVAELFGFGSADAMITAMLKAPKMADEIEAATELRMLERYGDISSPGALDAAASAAIHNDVRARFVATELNATEKGTGKVRLIAKAARQYAKDMIDRLKVREIRPAQYEAAERRAATRAIDAMKKGDTAMAASEKRAQLLNLYATKEARTALDEVDSAIDYFRKFTKKGTRQNIDPDYLDQIDKMLERFDLRVSAPDEAQQERANERRVAALSAWIEEQRNMGYEPIFSDDDLLTDESQRIHYRDLTMDEMRGLRDAVKNIEHFGRLKRELLKNKETRELAVAVANGAAAVREGAYKTVREPLGARTWLDRAKSGVDDFLAMHRKMSSMVREMDANKDRGVLWGLFSRPMNAATDEEAVRTADATQKLSDIFETLRKDDTRKRTYVPEIGRAISLETRLMVAANMGNSVNLERIMTGESWTPEQLQAVISPLTEQHWQFVQRVWDYIGTYWADIAAKEKRVTGVVPERVEAAPLNVQTSDGAALSLRGGYFPIKYDPDRSSRSEADTAAEVLRQMQRGLYASAQTRRGHVKARVDSTGRALRYDFGVVFEHVNQVIHDLSWHETLIDMNRLIKGGELDAAIREHYGPATIRWMRKALEDIAIGGLGAQNSVERAANYLRSGATISGLGWNLMTSLFQPLGLLNSIARIGPQYVGKGVMRALTDAASLQNTAKWVHEQSDFMRLRGQTMQREIAEIRQKFEPRGPIRGAIERVPGGEPVMSAVHASFFVLIEKAQMIADIPTWAGAYEKSIDEGADHDTSVAFADQTVRDSQGGGQISDLAGIQRGGPFMKLWTNFYSWFNVAYNQLAESTNDTRRNPSRLPLLAVDFLLIAVMPNLILSIVRGAIKGDDPDERRKRIINDQLGGYLGFIFGLRELGSMFGVGSSYQGPAGARAISATVDLGKQAQQGKADEAFWKATNQVGGVLFHYPAGQVQRTVEGFEAMADGKTRNPLVILTGPGKK